MPYRYFSVAALLLLLSVCAGFALAQDNPRICGVPEGGFLQITNATPGIGLTAPTDTSQAEFAEELEQHGEDKQIAWGAGADAADLAYVLYQVPVLVAVHASEMLTVKQV